MSKAQTRCGRDYTTGETRYRWVCQECNLGSEWTTNLVETDRLKEIHNAVKHAAKAVA